MVVKCKRTQQHPREQVEGVVSRSWDGTFPRIGLAICSYVTGFAAASAAAAVFLCLSGNGSAFIPEF